MVPLTRRRLLFAGAGAVSTLAAMRMLRGSSSLQSRQAAIPPGVPPTALVGCDSYDRKLVRDAMERGLQLAPPPDVSGKTVLLKPNFVEYSADRPVTTHVDVIIAAARAFRDLGARHVVIGEGPGHNPDTDYVWHRSGLYRAASEDQVPLVDLNFDDLVLTHMRTFDAVNGFRGRALEHLYLPKAIVTADLVVSMPKLKTHHWAGFTLSMKNLYGVVPGVKYGWPKNILHMNGIERSIVELTMSIQPGYAIADGIQGMEGDGPIMGTPVASDCLLFGRSLYAVDWLGATLMGLDPARLDVIRLASATGLGPLSAPPVVGDPASGFVKKFAVPPRYDSLHG